jgi:hypothetical protein
MIEIGFIPRVNIAVNTIHANAKFTVTHHRRMMIFFQTVALIKLSGALKSSVSLGSSPLSLTNHPNGIRLTVYSVPDLSVQSLNAFGGIPIPNSSTFTPDFLAAIKCPSSWIITKNINNAIQSIMPVMGYFLR